METPLIDMTIEHMMVACDKTGIDTHTYADLIDEMYWDGFTVREIKEQIQVIEGDASICLG
tara:strand:- start:198 stop:380 length:183 start_codon:yes stop_codon:yes gene_type:complete